MNRATVTAAEIAEAKGKTVRAIHKRAIKDGWPFEMVKGRGGGRKEYFLESLPEDVRIALAARKQIMTKSPFVPQNKNDTCDLKQGQINKALAKADLLRLYAARLKAAKWGNKKKVRRDFMRAYNSGIAYPQIFEVLGEVSWKTIEGWKRMVKTSGDTLGLADRRGYGKRGRRELTDEQEQILLRCALHPNKPLISEVIRMTKAVMSTKGISDGRSDATYRRWLKDWAGHNHHIWTFSRKGAKAWNDECAFSIERDYSLINTGDILVADGHTLNFEILNPWTGKPKRMIMILWYDMKSNFPLGWEIMPTENTQAIASALRRAILRLGKYPQVAYLDNGKAFASRFFKGTDFDQAGFSGLFERLGIKTIFAWPYHAQSKTVERFFCTFAELERWCPTYTGTSIEKKPPRMMRSEKLHRRAYDRLTQGKCITLEQAHRAIATWFDAYVQRPQQGHLCGAMPLDVFAEGKGDGVDPVELRYLMLSEDNRIVRRNGVPWLGRNYYAPELYGRRHPVTIRYDIQDASSILVFDAHGKFLCEAFETEKAHPAASILGTDEDRETLKGLIERKRSQEKAASVSARVFLEQEVLPEHRRLLEGIGISAEQGAQSTEQKPTKLTPADEKRIVAEAKETLRLTNEGRLYLDPNYTLEENESTEIWSALPIMSDTERYKKLTELEVRDWMMPKSERAWMRYYELTDEYQLYKDVFEEFRARVVSCQLSANSER